jgi:hypothetical protein
MRAKSPQQDAKVYSLVRKGQQMRSAVLIDAITDRDT